MQKKERKGKFSAVVDTGVLIDYINESSKNHDKAKTLLENENDLYITPITLSETVYVSYRIYKLYKPNNADELTRRFIAWLVSKLKVSEVNEEAIETEEIKESLARLHVI